jgi:hypothetical protein
MRLNRARPQTAPFPSELPAEIADSRGSK